MIADPINEIVKRVWKNLCEEAHASNQFFHIDSQFATPEDVNPDVAAMCKFIMTFYPEDRLEPFDDQ